MTDTELVRSAVRNIHRIVSRQHRGPRWAAVLELFAVGSTSAIELCRRFEVDPHEHIGPDFYGALQHAGIDENEIPDLIERMGWEVTGEPLGIGDEALQAERKRSEGAA